MSLAVLLNPDLDTFEHDCPAPAELAFKKLKEHSEAKKKLSKMRVEISPFSGTLNIFDTTVEDMKFFSKILGNEDYAYVPFLRLSSFYY